MCDGNTMLFDKQLAGEIDEFGEVQDAEFTAGGVTALIRRRAAPSCCWVRNGDSGSDSRNLARAATRASWTTLDPNTELRDTISVVSRSQYPLFSRTM